MVLLNNCVVPTNDKDEAFLGAKPSTLLQQGAAFGGESMLHRKQGGGEAREEPLSPPQMHQPPPWKGFAFEGACSTAADDVDRT